MTRNRQIEKVRSTASQVAALAAARREIKRWRYGSRERRQPGNSDIRL